MVRKNFATFQEIKMALEKKGMTVERGGNKIIVRGNQEKILLIGRASDNHILFADEVGGKKGYYLSWESFDTCISDLNVISF